MPTGVRAAVVGCALALPGLLWAQAAPNEGRPQPGPQLKIETDLEYSRAGGQALHLNLYRMAPSATPSPVVLWIHGASGPLATHVVSPAVGLVAPGGVAVASVEYRTARGTTVAMQLADMKAAVRWLRANAAQYNLDSAHIAAFGYDTGGQLAALLGTTGDVAALEGDGGSAGQSSRVQAFIDVAGPVQAGGSNAVDYVTPDDAPALLVHGSADAQVSTRQSQALIAALKVAGVEATLDMPFGVSHEQGELLSPQVMQSVGGFLNHYLLGARMTAGLSPFVATPPGTYMDPVGLDLQGTQYRLYPAPSQGAGTQASYRLYLPPGYSADSSRRYPVIYFIHGRSVDSKRPLTAGYIARADAAIRSGVMPPTIIVLAQGDNTGWYVDSQDGQRRMESILIKDLIPHVDATYRTIARREARAIEGHSMGGYGALHLGFKYPQLFVAVTGNSPALIEQTTDGVGDQAFWDRESPTTLAKANVDKLRQQRIRVIVGDKDGLFAVGKKMDEWLTSLNVPHGFFPVHGSPHNHDQLLQYETFDTMAFYGEVFGGVKGAKRGR